MRHFCANLVLLALAALFSGAQLASAEDSISVDLVEKGTDVFYLSANLGGVVDSELLFDTGSGYLAINQRTLNALETDELATYERTIRAKMANGKVRKVDIYRIASITLGDRCTLRNVEAAILPGATRNILGMNVLKMVHSFSFAFEPARLTLSGCRSEPLVAAN